VVGFRAPGRESRLPEQPHRELAALIAEAADSMQAHLETPYALFGHSFGGLVAFEVARELRRRRLPGPILLVVAACAPPNARRPGAPPPREDLLRLLLLRAGDLGATELDDEVVELALRPLEADAEAAAGYSYSPEPPLECPMMAMAGRGDPEIEPAVMAGWRAQAASDFRMELLEGGHFFPETARPEVLRLLAGALARAPVTRR
jgi:medium-chain acyl-[acyl-carrier-protein] hydrolase